MLFRKGEGYVKGAESGMSALAKAMGMAGGTNPAELLRDKLISKGFEHLSMKAL